MSIYSILSIFSFLTKGLLIFSGIQSGLFFGASTSSFHALKMCTFFVPRSLRRIISGLDFVPSPRFAAFRAACRGCFPVKTPCSLPSMSRKTKFLVLDTKVTSQIVLLDTDYVLKYIKAFFKCCLQLLVYQKFTFIYGGYVSKIFHAVVNMGNI